MQKSDLFNLNYYRQADFTGSRGNVCYRLSLKDGGSEQEQFLFQWWNGPLATRETEEEKQEKLFPYTDEGLDAIVDFINNMEVKPMRGDLFGEIMKKHRTSV